MVIMKHCLLIAGCLLMITCQAMENKDALENKDVLRRIEEKDLPNMIGKCVIYESLQKQIETGILDKPMAVNSEFYIIFNDVNPGKKQGTVCLKDKMFYAPDQK